MSIFNKPFVYIPLIVLGVILLLISIFAPISVKIDNQFSQLISSDKYKQSDYEIYTYKSDDNIRNYLGYSIPDGYLIKNKKRNTYFSNQYEYSELNGNMLYFCVMRDKTAAMNLFNKLNE
jgi:hypothetical protein